MSRLRDALLVVALLISGWTLAQTQTWPPANGATVPSTCSVGQAFWVTTATATELYRCTATNSWTLHDPAATGGGPPAGTIVLVDSGACPAGYTEQTGLTGRTIIGTLNANADVGTTGGADTVTPDAHAGTAVADHASHTHTYTQVVNHTHGFTDVRGTTTGGQTTAHGFTEANDTSSGFTSTVTGNPSGGVASGTTAGPSAIVTHGVTQPATHAGLDNRSAFARVIFCQKD